MSGFDDTVLERYGLIFYDSNGTLSNSSNCYYIAPVAAGQPFPILYENGTILPAPNQCSDPVRSIRLHGIIGIIFGCDFVVLIILILFNLQQHHNHRKGQNIDGVATRRQYVLALLAAVIGMVTSFVAIDVDREVIPGLPFKLQCIFYSLEQMSLLLTMIEATHSRLSQLERIHGITASTRRIAGRQIDLWLVSSYVLMASAIGLIMIRDWNDLSAQWYPLQTEQTARIAGTDARFKTGYLITLFCVLGVVFRLLSIEARFYKQVQNVAKFRRSGRAIYLTLTVLLCIWITVYNAASSFIWHVSPYNITVSQRYYYCGGMLPCVAALILLHAAGVVENRGGCNAIDVTTEIQAKGNNIRKPHWWRHSRHHMPEDDMIPLTLHDLRDVRGRDEKYENAGSWWWWRQEDKNIDDSASSNHQLEQSPSGLDQITEEQLDVLTSELETHESSLTHVSALRQPISADTKSRRKQISFKSMLDI